MSMLRKSDSNLVITVKALEDDDGVGYGPSVVGR